MRVNIDMRARALSTAPKVCLKERRKAHALGAVSKVTGKRIAFPAPQQKLHLCPLLRKTFSIYLCCVAIAVWLAPFVFPAARPTQAEGIIFVTVIAIMSRQPGAEFFSNGAIMSRHLCASAAPEPAPSTSRETKMGRILSTILAVLERYVGLFFYFWGRMGKILLKFSSFLLILVRTKLL